MTVRPHSHIYYVFQSFALINYFRYRIGWYSRQHSNTLQSILTSVSIFYYLLSFYFSLPFCCSFFTRFIFYIHFFLFQLSLSSSYLMSSSIGWHSSFSFSRLRSCTMLYTVLHYKGKGKVLPRTGHENPEGCRGIAPLFL